MYIRMVFIVTVEGRGSEWSIVVTGTSSWSGGSRILKLQMLTVSKMKTFIRKAAYNQPILEEIKKLQRISNFSS